MCQSPSNPAVAAARLWACDADAVHAAPPWVPGCAKVMIGHMPALNNYSKLMCSFGGVISINFAGQATVNIP